MRRSELPNAERRAKRLVGLRLARSDRMYELETRFCVSGSSSERKVAGSSSAMAQPRPKRSVGSSTPCHDPKLHDITESAGFHPLIVTTHCNNDLSPSPPRAKAAEGSPKRGAVAG